MTRRTNKSQKQIKVQGIYRKIKHQDNDNIRNNPKVGTVIVYACVFLWILLLILNAIFDL